ncbi:MAG: ankyrin repeat domain-containing protein [Alphaproteobacteria bacterium]|nr:ankyrin repeat domain-containing protein [Alphaproteobacteria bacterium]
MLSKIKEKAKAFWRHPYAAPIVEALRPIHKSVAQKTWAAKDITILLSPAGALVGLFFGFTKLHGWHTTIAAIFGGSLGVGAASFAAIGAYGMLSSTPTASRKFKQGLAMALSHYKRKKTPAASPDQIRNIFNAQSFVARHLGQALIEEISAGREIALNYAPSTLKHLRMGPALPNVEKCRALIQAGADVNTQDAFGNTPLMWAVTYTGKSALRGLSETLIRYGADDSLKNSYSQTAYFLACLSTGAHMEKVKKNLKQEQFMQAVKGGTPRKRKIHRRKSATQGPAAC